MNNIDTSVTSPDTVGGLPRTSCSGFLETTDTYRFKEGVGTTRYFVPTAVEDDDWDDA